MRSHVRAGWSRGAPFRAPAGCRRGSGAPCVSNEPPRNGGGTSTKGSPRRPEPQRRRRVSARRRPWTNLSLENGKAKIYQLELRMRRRHRWLGVALGLSLLPAVSTADIYSYVDNQGVAHFTNKPSGDARYRLYMKSRDGSKRRSDSYVAPNDTSVERFSRYGDVIREAAGLYQIPEELVRAVIKVESDYDPQAVSRVGAQGLMQLMPETAQRMQVRDVMDPRENVLGGVRYLRVLANMFNGDLQLTLAGYNAGENAVVRHGGIPPFDETEDYVVRVLAYYRRYRETRDPVAASVAAADDPGKSPTGD